MPKDKLKSKTGCLRTCQFMPLLGCDKGLERCIVVTRLKHGPIAKEQLGNV